MGEYRQTIKKKKKTEQKKQHIDQDPIMHLVQSGKGNITLLKFKRARLMMTLNINAPLHN